MQRNKNHYQKGFVKIGRVIVNSSKTANFQPAMTKYQVFKNWEQVVCSFFEKAKGQTKALEFNSGVLTVACLSRDLAYEIRLLAKKITQVINEIIGKAVVFALRVEC